MGVAVGISPNGDSNGPCPRKSPAQDRTDRRLPAAGLGEAAAKRRRVDHSFCSLELKHASVLHSLHRTELQGGLHPRRRHTLPKACRILVHSNEDNPSGHAVPSIRADSLDRVPPALICSTSTENDANPQEDSFFSSKASTSRGAQEKKCPVASEPCPISASFPNDVIADALLDCKKPATGVDSDDVRIHLGVRVEIYWDGEQQYFSGTVVKERSCEPSFFVEYDDGDKEWINFSKERYRILPGERKDNSLKHPEMEVSNQIKESSTAVTENVEGMDWVAATGISRTDSDSETDEEELMQWAIKMLGTSRPPIARRKSDAPAQSGPSVFKCDWQYGSDDFVPMSISEKVKLARRNRSTSVSYAAISPSKKPKGTMKAKFSAQAQCEAEAKRKKEQSRPLTSAEIKSILENDTCEMASSSWVRRSVRQPSKSSLAAPRVKQLLEKLLANDSDMIVLKMKKYCSDLDTPTIVIDAVLDALEENTNCEALYIQNFNEGMRDEQVLHLLRILQRPSCKIWCLNIGETYKVQMKTWEKFTKGLAETNITHMYASEHTITAELKEQIRETIRLNRRKHHWHDDPANIDTIVQCTHCWWNPINTKSLRPYLHRKGYDHILQDAETQGLPGTMSGAFLS